MRSPFSRDSSSGLSGERGIAARSVGILQRATTSGLLLQSSVRAPPSRAQQSHAPTDQKTTCPLQGHDSAVVGSDDGLAGPSRAPPLGREPTLGTCAVVAGRARGRHAGPCHALAAHLVRPLGQGTRQVPDAPAELGWLGAGLRRCRHPTNRSPHPRSHPSLRFCSRLFDAFLSSHPLLPLYVSAAVLSRLSDELRGAISRGIDFPEVHRMLTSQDVAAVAKADELLAEGQALLQRVPPATLVSAPIPGPRLALHAPFAERAADGAWAVPAAGRVVEGSAAGRVA